MKKLVIYLNSISDEERNSIAMACGTSVGYLRKACSAGQKIGPALCVSIERETQGAVTRIDLRPDDWNMIWPELTDVEVAA